MSQQQQQTTMKMKPKKTHGSVGGNKASGKPQGQTKAPWAMKQGKKSGGMMGNSKAPIAAKRGAPSGKTMGQKTMPKGLIGGKPHKQIRSKAKLGGGKSPSMAMVQKSVAKTMGY